MKFYNINTQGKFWLHRVDTLPETISEDEGRMVYNRQSETIYFRNSLGWSEITTTIPSTITKGIFGGGYYTGALNSIEYLNIGSLGSSGYDFGDLSVAQTFLGGTSNGVNQRGLFAGGSASPTNTIEYITINILSNSSDFGDLTLARDGIAGCSNSTNERGVFAGGDQAVSSYVNVIDYVTINSVGNASDFGDLAAITFLAGGTSNATNERGVFAGKWAGSNVIEYITISSTGNASDFGDLTVSRAAVGATSNYTNERGIFTCGYNSGDFNTIDYITINSTGDATDFGDATEARYECSSVSNGTLERGITGGGRYHPGGAVSNTIDYVTISSTGDAADFGDLLIPRGYSPATFEG
ncbi:MAG: hypothetical protein ACFFG0_03785 [Candidatus Thorarchaeota archaeon]